MNPILKIIPVVVLTYVMGTFSNTLIIGPDYVLLQKSDSSPRVSFFWSRLEDYSDSLDYNYTNIFTKDSIYRNVVPLNEAVPYLLPEITNGFGIHSVKEELIDSLTIDVIDCKCWVFKQSFEAERLDILNGGTRVNMMTWCEALPGWNARQIYILNHIMLIDSPLQKKHFRGKPVFILNKWSQGIEDENHFYPKNKFYYSIQNLSVNLDTLSRHEAIKRKDVPYLEWE